MDDEIVTEEVVEEPDALETRLSTYEQALKEQREYMTAQTKQIEELRQNRQQPQPQQSQPGIDIEAWDERFRENPTATSAEVAEHIANNRMQQMRQEQEPIFNTLSEVAKQSARNKDPELFDALEKEINSMVTVVPSKLRANPKVWENAMATAAGQNLSKVINLKRSDNHKVVAKGGSRPTSSKPPSAPSGLDSLTDDEKYWIQRYDVTPEQYLEAKTKGNELFEDAFTYDSRHPGRRVPNRKETVNVS